MCDEFEAESLLSTSIICHIFYYITLSNTVQFFFFFWLVTSSDPIFLSVLLILFILHIYHKSTAMRLSFCPLHTTVNIHTIISIPSVAVKAGEDHERGEELRELGDRTHFVGKFDLVRDGTRGSI